MTARRLLIESSYTLFAQDGALRYPLEVGPGTTVAGTHAVGAAPRLDLTLLAHLVAAKGAVLARFRLLAVVADTVIVAVGTVVRAVLDVLLAVAHPIKVAVRRG